MEPTGVDIDRDLELLEGTRLLAPGYQRRKLVGYCVRTAIAAAFYAVFWRYAWVRWTLVLYAPLNIGGLIFILFGPRLLRRKVEGARRAIDELRLEAETEADGETRH